MLAGAIGGPLLLEATHTPCAWTDTSWWGALIRRYDEGPSSHFSKYLKCGQPANGALNAATKLHFLEVKEKTVIIQVQF